MWVSECEIDPTCVSDIRREMQETHLHTHTNSTGQPLSPSFLSSRMFSIRSKGVSGTVGILLARTPYACVFPPTWRKARPPPMTGETRASRIRHFTSIGISHSVAVVSRYSTERRGPP